MMIKETVIEKRIRQLEEQIKKSNDKKFIKTIEDKINYINSEKSRIKKELDDKVKSLPEHTIKIKESQQELADKKTKLEEAQQQSRLKDTKLTEKLVEIGKKLREMEEEIEKNKNPTTDEEIKTVEEMNAAKKSFQNEGKVVVKSLQDEKKAAIKFAIEKQKEEKKAQRFVNEKIAQKDAVELHIRALDAALQ